MVLEREGAITMNGRVGRLVSSSQGGLEEPICEQIGERTLALLRRSYPGLDITHENYPFGSDEYDAATEQANAEGADWVIHLHANSNGEAAYGYQLIYRGDNSLNTFILRGLQEAGIDEHSKFEGYMYRENIYALNHARQAVSYIEVGYYSNPKERARLESAWYQDLIARGIYLGTRYFLAATYGIGGSGQSEEEEEDMKLSPLIDEQGQLVRDEKGWFIFSAAAKVGQTLMAYVRSKPDLKVDIYLIPAQGPTIKVYDYPLGGWEKQGAKDNHGVYYALSGWGFAGPGTVEVHSPSPQLSGGVF